jgi:predicted Rossmann fold nucleotide-binding protein DprA/Smf involved in DNA uptake
MHLTQQKLLYYSLDETITLGKLKKIPALSPAQTQLLENPTGTKLIQRMEKHHIIGNTQDNNDYPFKLTQTKTPPYLFYAKGNLNLLNQNILGIV